MTTDRFSGSDRQLTDALRAHYAAPADDSYWVSLESRILAHVARGTAHPIWYRALPDLLRPGLLAAAGLILAASLAMAHSRRAEALSAYAMVISPYTAALDAGSRASVTGDGDAAMHFILSH